MLEYILMAVPVIFLVGSVIYAYKSVTVRKHTRKRAVLSQLAAFAAVSVVCLVTAAITAFAPLLMQPLKLPKTVPPLVLP